MKQKQKELETSQERWYQQNSKSFYGSMDRSNYYSQPMMSTFRKTASQIAIYNRIEQSKAKREKIDKEIEQKIEKDKRSIVEKCNDYKVFKYLELRSAINHELVLEDIVSNLREKSMSSNFT